MLTSERPIPAGAVPTRHADQRCSHRAAAASHPCRTLRVSHDAHATPRWL